MTHDEIRSAIAEHMEQMCVDFDEGLLADFGERLPFVIAFKTGKVVQYGSNVPNRQALAEMLRQLAAKVESECPPSSSSSSS